MSQNLIVNDLGQLVEAAGAPGSPERVAVEHPALIASLRDWNLLIQDRHQEKTEPLIYKPGLRESLASSAAAIERTLAGMDGDIFDKTDHLHDAHLFHFFGASLGEESTPALEGILLESAGWPADEIASWPARRKEVGAQFAREVAALRRESFVQDYDWDEVPSRPFSLPRRTAEGIRLIQRDGEQAVLAKADGLTRAVKLPLLLGQAWAVTAEFDQRSEHVRPLVKGIHPITGREVAATFVFSPSVPASRVTVREDKSFAPRPFVETYGTTQVVSAAIMADINDEAKRSGQTARISAVMITDRQNIDSDDASGGRGVNRLHLCSSVAFAQRFKAGSSVATPRTPGEMLAEARKAAPGIGFSLGSTPDDRLAGGDADGIQIEDVGLGEYTLRRVIEIQRGQPRFYIEEAREFLAIASAVGQQCSKADEKFYDAGQQGPDEASLGIQPISPPLVPDGARPLPARVDRPDGSTVRTFGGPDEN